MWLGATQDFPRYCLALTPPPSGHTLSRFLEVLRDRKVPPPTPNSCFIPRPVEPCSGLRFCGCLPFFPSLCCHGQSKYARREVHLTPGGGSKMFAPKHQWTVEWSLFKYRLGWGSGGAVPSACPA